MEIKIILYSDLKVLSPGGSGQFALDMPPGATLGDVFTRIGMPPDRPVTALVNGRRAEKKTPFTQGDTLVVFPQLCGG